MNPVTAAFLAPILVCAAWGLLVFCAIRSTQIDRPWWGWPGVVFSLLLMVSAFALWGAAIFGPVA